MQIQEGKYVNDTLLKCEENAAISEICDNRTFT